MKNPIIIIGMHRSGTSLLAQTLEKINIFMGNVKDQHHEAVFFQKFNEWLLEQAGVTWCNPGGYRFFQHNRLLERVFLQRFKSIFSLSYWGFPLWLSHKNNLLWGWKDPRNSFTLPFWRCIFPDAKIIHIIRNPVDVAKSLQVRTEKNCKKRNAATRLSCKSLCKALVLRGVIAVPTQRLLNPVEGIRLWEEYIKRIESYNLSDINSLTIKYESLLAQPEREMCRITDFLQLPVLPESKLQTITASLRRDRAYAHTAEERNNLLSQCPDCKDTIARYYGDMYE